MKLLIAVAILVTLALAGSSRRFWGWRRSRLGAALTTGGWLFVLMGFSIGPHGLKLALPEQLLAVQPLIHFCLGWVGLVIGLQLDRRLPMMLPAPVRWLAVSDAVVSVAGMTAIAAGVLWWRDERGWAIGPVVGVLGVAAVGWSADVRSLRREGGAKEQLAKVMRATGAVCGILAVIAYGLMFKSFEVADDGEVLGWSGRLMAQGAAVSLGIGVTMGVMGKWLMGVAGRGTSQFLVVLLGLTAMVAGAAATMGYSPMFVALGAGAALCNLSGKALEPLKRVIIEAEQPLAMVLMLVAGVLMDPALGATGLWVLGAMLVGRAAVKSAIGRWGVRRAMGDATSSRALSSLVRQSPLAVALATGYAMSPYARAGAEGPLSGGQVVAVVVLVGLIAELWALLRAPREPITSKAASESTEAPKATDAETDAEPTADTAGDRGDDAGASKGAGDASEAGA